MNNPPKALDHPHVSLCGEVEAGMVDRCREQAAAAGDADPLVIEMTTLGGEAEYGRRLALEFRSLASGGRRVLFLGKTTLYSAGVTAMSGLPVADRWLSDDCLLLVHGRKIVRTLELDGGLIEAQAEATRLLAEVKATLPLEEQGFRELVEGSRMDLEDLRRRARRDWYLTAAEALDLGLVAGIWAP
jgi:ATP-dependent protease ClpP protease subunit